MSDITNGLSFPTISPCPFCGNDELEWDSDESETVIWLECQECNATGPTAPTHEDVAALWNQRGY